MPLAQDRSFDLLASSPARYHCTTDASLDDKQTQNVTIMDKTCHRWLLFRQCDDSNEHIMQNGMNYLGNNIDRIKVTEITIALKEYVRGLNSLTIQNC